MKSNMNDEWPYILVFADKTSNVFKLNTQNYQKLLKENITMTHKKTLIKLEKGINSEAKSITNKLGFSDRMDYSGRLLVKITLKDHKEKFFLQTDMLIFISCKNQQKYN